MSDHSFILAGEDIAAGEVRHLELPVARLPTQTMLSLPVTIVNGTKSGPRLWLSAAIHGDEINGVEIIRQVIGKIKPQQLKGTLIAVPIVNIFGFIEQSRYLPDRRDLNRCFPGSATGSLASRLAHLFMEEIVSGSTHGIDLHTAAIHRTNLHLQVALGERVEKKQVMATISDAFGDTSVPLRAKFPGLVIGHVQNPLINQGDGIIHLAKLE